MYTKGIQEKGLFSENLPFRLVSNEVENFIFDEHWHNAIEIVYILQGEFDVASSGKKYSLKEQDILFIPQGELHSITSKGNGLRYFLQFDITLFFNDFDYLYLKTYLSRFIHISRNKDGALNTLLTGQLNDFIKSYAKLKPTGILSLKARIYDFFAILLEKMDTKAFSDTENSAKNRVQGYQKIEKVFKFIEENYSSDISLAATAMAAGFSSSHFSRMFKEITEKNFHFYLNEFRIKKAEKLLVGEFKSISEIAYEVGFNSVSTFNRVFHEQKNCSPTEYRGLFRSI